MSEVSRPWDGIVTGDCGPYASSQWADVWGSLFIGKNAATQGVLATYLNELAVSDGGGNNVNIATGAAIVDGRAYINSSVVTKTVTAPTDAPRIDLVVLQCSWSAQTIRIVVKTGIEGKPVPTLVQTRGITWEIPLSQITITPGNVRTFVDRRSFAYFSSTYGHNIPGDVPLNWDTGITSKLVTAGGNSHSHTAGQEEKIDYAPVGSTSRVTNRQGGSATNWQDGSAATNYDLTSYDLALQIGSYYVSPGPAYQKAVTITFPTSYAGYNIKPLVVATINPFAGVQSNIPLTVSIGTVTSTNFTATLCWDVNSYYIDYVYLLWFAVGRV